MCRVLGCVADEPVSIRHELLEAENPLIRQSEAHDSGWGVAVYERGEGDPARCVRFPEAAYSDGEFVRATDARGRIFNAHVRRATIGGLSAENTHPFCMGNYSFSHNGTVPAARRLAGPGVRPSAGETDTEVLFNVLMRDFDPGDPIAGLHRLVSAVIDCSPFSALNFLFSDGERLYAYRLGLFDLHWLHRGHELFVATERITEEAWHTVAQDVLLVADPSDIEEPHAERLVGDRVLERAEVRPFDDGAHLRGVERGDFAAARAEQLAAEHT